MKGLYKYPQAAFPYAALVEENLRRGRGVPEFELIESGVFDGDRYWDVTVEYAKAGVDDILVRIAAANRGPEPVELHVAPTLWFRNTWVWDAGAKRPRLSRGTPGADHVTVDAEHPTLGSRRLFCEGAPRLLFTENETNTARLFDTPNVTPHVKDGIGLAIVGGYPEGVNPAEVGTKVAAHYRVTVPPGGEAVLRLRLSDGAPAGGPFGVAFETTMRARQEEADAFFDALLPAERSEDARRVMRQAVAGLLWSKQFYHLDVRRWLAGDPTQPLPPETRALGRNHGWEHLYNEDVISMPDKWEYPWYAAWDLAFHMIPLALLDPEFAKTQLILFLREWYMHPNGQIPAYEWNFGDVNPPVHAWAAWRVYKIDRRLRGGKGDRQFLEKVFHKLLLNFTWWVNRKDAEGNNVFQGGFLGLDNIGVFDRSAPLPTGGHMEQSDGTSWMGMYSLNMLAIALELAQEDSAYEDVASKFFEHFMYIAHAMHHLGGEGGMSLWNEADGFYYDVLHSDGREPVPLRVRSMVGLIPLFAVETLEPEQVDRLEGFKRRMQWFVDNRPDLADHIVEAQRLDGKIRRLLSIVTQPQLPRVLSYMLDEGEFLAPHGIRALSRYHRDHPYILEMDGMQHRVDYEPGESSVPLFGGNSNWRGPIWFPVNYLLIESLQKFDWFLGEGGRVECPARSGRRMKLWDISVELSRRLSRIFLRGADGRRPVFGDVETFPARSALARPDPVPRVLPRGDGRGPGRQPPDGVDGARGQAHRAERRVGRGQRAAPSRAAGSRG
jgi:hypothetical protein